MSPGHQFENRPGIIFCWIFLFREWHCSGRLVLIRRYESLRRVLGFCCIREHLMFVLMLSTIFTSFVNTVGRVCLVS